MKPSSKELLDILYKVFETKADVVPDGFKTRAQWQAEWGCSSSHAKGLLKAGQLAGLIEMRKIKVKSGHSITPTPHYGPTKVGKLKKPRR